MTGEGAGTGSFVLKIPPFTVPAEWYGVPDPRGALIVLPAMGTPAHVYRTFAEALQSRRFGVCLPDLPGTGASEPKPSREVNFGYRDLVERFLPDLIAAVRKRAPGRPVVAVGHSLGGQVAALGVIHGHADPAAVVTLAAGHIHYRHWQGLASAKVLFAAILFPFLAFLIGYLPGRRVGFGGPQARDLIREWARTIRTGRMPEISGARREPGCPALSIGYEGDFLAPMNSVIGLAALLKGATTRLPVHWPGPPHSSWARYPESTADTMETWLTDNSVVARAQG